MTAGPTREAIDPVRYISNRSWGRMGYAVAEAARRRGANVTLISGPPRSRCLRRERHAGDHAAEIRDAVMKALPQNRIPIKAAA